MARIQTSRGPLDLPENFSIPVEDTNPVYNERGSQSLPVTVPATPRNNELTGFPTRPSSEMVADKEPVSVVDGTYIRSGLLNMVSAGKKEGITFNIGFDNSTAYETWSKRKLSELEGLPSIVPDGDNPGEDIYDIILGLYLNARPDLTDLAVFPVVVDNKSREVETTAPASIKETEYYYEILNKLPNEKYRSSRKIKRLVNGEVTEITVPKYYGLTAFPWLWKVVEMVFADMDYRLASNPFREDRELSRIVVLNNVADACCRNRLDYVDLMPDVTVEEFLQSLWVRFGFTFVLDYDRKTVRPALVRDILKAPSALDVTGMATEFPLVNFETPRYVKLSAATSLEGAAPATERFEDFIKGYSLDNIIFGRAVSDWGWRDEADDFEYDWPEYNDDVDWDPDEGREEWDWDDFHDDYWDDYDDWGGDDRDWSRESSARAMAAPLQSVSPAAETAGRLAFEVRTSLWFKLDKENHLVDTASTSFFNWDPQSEGLDVLELSSVDEFVPLEWVSDKIEGDFHETVPMFLTGAKFRHTYISQGEDDEDSDKNGETPLAFLFAFNNCSEIEQGTVGRFSPETAEGKNVEIWDGQGWHTHTLSLLFQFRNGLFARFWKDFDELLRHGARTVEVSAALPKTTLRAMDILSPLGYDNSRYLVDTMSYSLPARAEVEVDLTLRPLFPAGRYDIATDQGIPAFEPGTRRSRWCYESTNIREVCLFDSNRALAIARAKEEHPEITYGHSAYRFAAKFISAVEKGLRWSSDPSNLVDAPVGGRKTCAYKATATYEIYRSWQQTVPGDPTPGVITGHDETPCATVGIEVTYTVTLVGKWVQR